MQRMYLFLESVQQSELCDPACLHPPSWTPEALPCRKRICRAADCKEKKKAGGEYDSTMGKEGGNQMKPILFNTEMVRAILDGRKSVTRRVVKPQPIWSDCGMRWWWKGDRFWWRDNWDPMESITYQNSIFRPGDILYVRETWRMMWDGTYRYRADPEEPKLGWRPSIHMPKEAARLFLRVTDVRVERLQEINHDGIRKEGIVTVGSPGSPERINPFFTFKDLWDSTIKKADLPRYGWDANPYVWRVSFEGTE